ncbi:MAG: TIGR03088 family PEP-CTERM/XrtA system glycosyltransferase [Gammaproteobacteria bacterium]|nr:TIGR03088 family PEP-CTERM/XrtA system glycosyltransferase [Gammaproteobacteria bacterium]
MDSDVVTHRPLIAHVIYRLDVGGLENGLVNIINRTPAERYRHAIISLTDVSEFQQRITRDDVPCIALHKRPGNDLGMLWKLWRIFRELRPAIVHSRNLAAMEAQLPAWLAGVPCRIHGEHGRDIFDLDGTSRKYRWVRRLYKPLVHRYVALSQELNDYLGDQVGVAESRLRLICNGVDVERFRPRGGECREAVLPQGFADQDSLLIGSVGRLEAVKDQLTLVRAFKELCRQRPDDSRLRLVLVGDGSLRGKVEELVAHEGMQDRVWLAGSREDVPRLLSALDVFVLPSLAEGISNTILEAMACGLPVVATRVGGNEELLCEDETGFLVPRADPLAMAAALLNYVDHTALRTAHGAAARTRVEDTFSIARMVSRYLEVYDELYRQRCLKSGGQRRKGREVPGLNKP